MKKTKMFAAFAVLVLTTGVFFACSKDDDGKKTEDTGYPKVLTYKGYEVKGIQMYVGSANGGVKVETNNTELLGYFENHIPNNAAEGYTFTFFNASEMEESHGGNDIKKYVYKFENDILYVDDRGKWELNGYGSVDNFQLRYGYFYNSLTKVNNREDEYCTLELVLERSGFNSLLNMTNSTDTIMWCDVDFIFK